MWCPCADAVHPFIALVLISTRPHHLVQELAGDEYARRLRQQFSKVRFILPPSASLPSLLGCRRCSAAAAAAAPPLMCRPHA